MEKGWIKIFRQIQDCWIWDDGDKFDKAHAWIDLLLLANHRDKKISVDGKPIVITRGMFLTSKVKLAQRWHWNIKTVDRFLKILESDAMITQENTHRWTTLTIVNYGVYQELMDNSTDNSMDNLMDNSMDNYTDNYTDNSLDTNKNVKNIKNVKNVKNERNIKAFFPNDELLNQTFEDFIKMRKKIHAPMSDRAIDLAINKLNELSGGDSEQAIEILNNSILHGWKGLFPLKQQAEQKSEFVARWENA